MNQTLKAKQQEAQTQRVGTLESPRIAPLGSLDDERQTVGLSLESASPKPLLAIIYNGI